MPGGVASTGGAGARLATSVLAEGAAADDAGGWGVGDAGEALGVGVEGATEGAADERAGGVETTGGAEDSAVARGEGVRVARVVAAVAGADDDAGRLEEAGAAVAVGGALVRVGVGEIVGSTAWLGSTRGRGAVDWLVLRANDHPSYPPTMTSRADAP